MNFLTLSAGGVEKWLGPVPSGASGPAWGFSNPVLTTRSRTWGTFTVRIPGGDPASFPIANDTSVTIYNNRTYSAGFSGGTIIFQGTLTPQRGYAKKDRYIQLTFADVLWQMSQTIFQQTWRSIGGQQYNPRVILFMDISGGPLGPWGSLSVPNQIIQIVSFAKNNCGLPVQLGANVSSFSLPIQSSDSLSILDALLKCIEPLVDLTTSIDYTTTPPTLNLFQTASKTQITLPYADASSHVLSEICPRPDLIPSQVVVKYQTIETITVGTQTQTDVSFSIDSYGPGGTAPPGATTATAGAVSISGGAITAIAIASGGSGYAYNTTVGVTVSGGAGGGFLGYASANTTGQITSITIVNGGGGFTSAPAVTIHPPQYDGNALRAIACQIDVQGAQITYEEGTVTSAAIDPTSAAYWKVKKPELANTSTSSVTIASGSVKIIDPTGTDVTSIILPDLLGGVLFELEPGSVPNTSWMSVGGSPLIIADYTITAQASWDENIAIASTQSAGYGQHQLSIRVRLTNSPAGTQTYTALASIDPGQPIPSNLAETVFNAAAVLQYEFDHEIVSPTIANIYSPANSLNVSGGAAAWATMNALVESVEHYFQEGRTIVHCGAHRNLSAPELFALITQYKNRIIWKNPSIRNTGQATDGATTSSGTDSHKENTTAGLPLPALEVWASPNAADSSQQNQIKHDSAAGQLIMRVLNPDGSEDTTGNSKVQLDIINDLPAGMVMKIRPVCIRVQTGGTGAFVTKTGYIPLAYAGAP